MYDEADRIDRDIAADEYQKEQGEGRVWREGMTIREIQEWAREWP